MPQQYTFTNGIVMTGWDVAVLAAQPNGERQAAYVARWGGKHLSCPPLNTGCREEELRRLNWPLKNDNNARANGGAKCWGCFFGDKPMPVGIANIPAGLNDEDLLPCGCEWKYVAIERFIKHKVNSLALYDKARNCIGQSTAPSTLTHEHRITIWETLEYMQGGNMTVLISDMLTGASRIAKTQVALTAGMDI